MDAVQSMFRAEADASGIELSCSFVSPAISPEMRLRCDSQRVAQVLINLVGNSMKFTRRRPVRSIHMQVNARRGDDDIIHVIFRVRDTGIGMTPTEMARLFIPFSQASVRTYRYEL